MRAKNALVKTWPYAYPVALERDLEGGTWAGFALDLPVFAWGKPDRQALLRGLREGLALALLELEEEGRPLPTPSASAQVPPEVAEGEVVFLEPAPVNPVSLELWRAMKARGLSQRELARRMGTSPSAVHRLLDPFYFGHSLDTLRRAAEALGGDLEVRLLLPA
jgi:antitoxin HicB